MLYNQALIYYRQNLSKIASPKANNKYYIIYNLLRKFS